jgi:hypothetical protein
MATTLLLLLVVLLAITSIPWFGGKSHAGIHRTDLMAGDEGED